MRDRLPPWSGSFASMEAMIVGNKGTSRRGLGSLSFDPLKDGFVTIGDSRLIRSKLRLSLLRGERTGQPHRARNPGSRSSAPASRRQRVIDGNGRAEVGGGSGPEAEDGSVAAGADSTFRGGSPPFFPDESTSGWERSTSFL